MRTDRGIGASEESDPNTPPPKNVRRRAGRSGGATSLNPYVSEETRGFLQERLALVAKVSLAV